MPLTKKCNNCNDEYYDADLIFVNGKCPYCNGMKKSDWKETLVMMGIGVVMIGIMWFLL